MASVCRESIVSFLFSVVFPLRLFLSVVGVWGHPRTAFERRAVHGNNGEAPLTMRSTPYDEKHPLRCPASLTMPRSCVKPSGKSSASGHARRIWLLLPGDGSGSYHTPAAPTLLRLEHPFSDEGHSFLFRPRLAHPVRPTYHESTWLKAVLS
ncbi:hypothetical protein VTK73DRAFT_4744 [Phialemonium thermophilum]|uniref:Secreted protein n=1 Tax=Phialemonium thermophilum TaxID=223376 RepID=A0ABR3V774_9PEZI